MENVAPRSGPLPIFIGLGANLDHPKYGAPRPGEPPDQALLVDVEAERPGGGMDVGAVDEQGNALLRIKFHGEVNP